MNITSGNITVKDGSEITLVGKADMNIGGNANIIMDYTGETPDNEHDGGILHEGQSGNLNISGGVINLTGEVAKIERGGYDGDWFYNSETGATMEENDGIKPAPEGADKDNYHVSTGNINITGGEINLKDGARISLTEKIPATSIYQAVKSPVQRSVTTVKAMSISVAARLQQPISELNKEMLLFLTVRLM